MSIYTVEAFLKIIVCGFAFNGKASYLRNGWNVMDFIVVVAGYIIIITDSLSDGTDELSSLKALRTLRVLRPLRVASRNEGMRVVVSSIFKSIPPVGNVILVGMLFYLIFAILGVNLNAGTFYSCKVDGER